MPELKVESLTFEYPGSDSTALDRVSLELPEGSLCVLSGDPGSGKTTLLRCLKREIAPAGRVRGSIKLGSEELIGSTVAPRIGIVLQDPASQMICADVVSELAFSLESSGMPQAQMERRLAEASAFFGISHLLDRRTSELSDGEKQMVSLAAACISDVDLLLLDEPTSHLDGRYTRSLCSALQELTADLGLTAIVATHCPTTFKWIATDSFEMHDGQLERKSRHEQAVQGGSSETGIPAHRRCGPVASSVPEDAIGEEGPLALRMDNASFRFDGSDAHVIDGADLQLCVGRIISIMGPNGSGKSTLLKLAAGIHEPMHGTVKRAFADSQAYLPQDVRLIFSRESVEEELMEAVGSNGQCSKAIAEVAKMLSLDGKLDANPYDLSYGQRQLLGVAKACLTGSQLILLDEPSKCLDPRSSSAVGRLIQDVASSGSAVLLTTHDVALAESVSDECAMMFDGKVTIPVPPIDFFGEAIFMRKASR